MTKTLGKFVIAALFVLFASTSARAQCSSTNPAGAQPIDTSNQHQYCNAGANISQGQIVSLNASGQVVPIPHGSTSGAYGVAQQNAQSGQTGVKILISGRTSVSTDNACAFGNQVGISSTNDGNGHCSNSTTTQVIGSAQGNSSAASSITTQISPLTSGVASPSGGVGSGTLGQPAAYKGASNVSTVPLNFIVDAFSGGGIGQAQVAWSSGNSYSLCQAVSNSGSNYIAVNTSNNAVTPGTNTAVWWPVQNTNTPTATECAFYISQAFVTSNSGVNLTAGSGVYPLCIGLTWPTVGFSGAPGVNVHGVGVTDTTFKQTCSISVAPFNIPPAATSFFLPRLQFSDFVLDANGLAPAVFDLHGCQQCLMENIDGRNAAAGSDHYFEFGTVGGVFTGWVYELTAKNLVTNWGSAGGLGHGDGTATFSVTVSGGVPTITVTNGGHNYNASQLSVRLVKAGGLEACTSIGTNTPTVSAGVITAITSTATGCAATGLTFVQVFPQTNVSYSFKFSNMSDSHTVDSLVPGGVGSKAGIFVSNTSSANKFTKVHPIATYNGIQNAGNSVFDTPQFDSVYNHAFEELGQFDNVTVVTPMFEWNGTHYDGSSDWYFANLTGSPTTAPNSFSIIGEMCLNQAQQNAYGHFVMSTLGTEATNSLPSYVVDQFPQFCENIGSAVTPTMMLAPIIQIGNGRNSNLWTLNFGGGGNSILTIQNTIGNQSGWTWQTFAPATSGANKAGFQLCNEGNFWNGSASTAFGSQLQTTFASGTNPVASHAFTGCGTSTGSYKYTFDATVQPALNNLTFSTTPAIDLTKGNTIQFACTTASSSVVPTISNLAKGIEFTVIFVQNGTTACTWTWPSAIHGAVAVSATLNSISTETFRVSNNGTDAYLISSVVGTTGGTP